MSSWQVGLVDGPKWCLFRRHKSFHRGPRLVLGPYLRLCLKFAWTRVTVTEIKLAKFDTRSEEEAKRCCHVDGSEIWRRKVGKHTYDLIFSILGSGPISLVFVEPRLKLVEPPEASSGCLEDKLRYLIGQEVYLYTSADSSCTFHRKTSPERTRAFFFLISGRWNSLVIPTSMIHLHLGVQILSQGTSYAYAFSAKFGFGATRSLFTSNEQIRSHSSSIIPISFLTTYDADLHPLNLYVVKLPKHILPSTITV